MALKDRLIQETAILIKGDTFTITKNGVEIGFCLFWETEDFPSFEIKEIKITREPTFLEKMLMDSFNGRSAYSRGSNWCGNEASLRDLDWHPILAETKPFKDWSRRIKKICDQADALEKAKKLDFHRDVLPAAQELLKNTRSDAVASV